MFKVLLGLLLVCKAVFAADVSMEIVKSVGYKPTIGISIASDSQPSTYSNDIKRLIAKDLEVSGHFNVKDVNLIKQFNFTPNYYELKQQNIDLFLNISIEQSVFEGFILKTKLYDLNSSSMAFEKSFNSSKDERYPFLAHKVAITVNDYINAPSIDWMERFVIFSRYDATKQSQIVIADYTLTFQKAIIQGGLNVFPKWANKNQDSFYYTTYNFGLPTLMKVDIFSGKSEKIAQSDGMLVCSDVNKDGTKLLLTMAPNSQPDIYEYDIRSKNFTRLTTYNGIDVNGHYLEDEKSIVFVSDRLGNPNIFSKQIGQRGANRLVYHGKNNNSANAYGNFVIYTSREGDNEFGKENFNIYLVSTQSNFIKKMTTSGMNQFPKFSQDGESIIFIKTENDKSYLGIIRLGQDKSFLFPLNRGNIQAIDW
ncbi:Tol-Pal system protein TolB [Arcobacter sp. FWKO B]|uniref:Tol-Pal system protein TolB n=1 Tax=Arcobacter sp. FWKO B TaxID=2593672 RepID=UPI0018A6529A|nr:Tol-Pal system protein TolB [Arcobacter sp. FWKO B]QOG11756.1 Tol-Pal system protein TolB [Arcobacter sp. FWKO B]